MELEPGLAAELLERVRVETGRRFGRGREPAERGDAGGVQLLDLGAVEPGDAAEVVDLVPPCVAERP